ncbi:hypothetical protein HID58_089233 [Brassica napus]|uniref:RNase H type-1 domain-containing protein n=1 Tax=Brassica napus TaxID=3708 RepID=A0ABQ7XYG4_BRANA|nr:hypothetical protein HID58_089233 [Brassica napus]
MYISHPNERERLGRIKRVQLSITEKQVEEANSIPIFTHDLKKNRGMVFEYEEGRDKLKSISLGGTPRRASSPLEVPETSDQSFSSAMIATSTTGFSVGTSSRNPTAGALSSQKKPRNRPTSWKRKLRISFSYEACEENRGRFYFDKRMLGKAGIEEAVMRGWSCGGKDARATLADIIIHCRKELAKWKRASNLNSRNVIEKLHECDDRCSPPPPPAIWQKPNLEDLKCNVGFSWINWQSNGGIAWILRNHSGNVLLHSRRAYSKPDSEVQAGLLSLLWATESMVNLHKKRVILEISSPVLRDVLSFPDAYQQYDSLFTDLQNNLLLIDSWCL